MTEYVHECHFFAGVRVFIGERPLVSLNSGISTRATLCCFRIVRCSVTKSGHGCEVHAVAKIARVPIH